MLYLALCMISSLVSADELRDLFNADLNPDGTCDSSATNCFADGVTAGEYCTNDIQFVGVERDAAGGSCCYTYKSVYTGTLDCEGKRSTQSHWTLSAQCPVDPNVMTAGLSKHVDSSLCLDGIKFDSECSDPNGCDYTICLEFPGEQCCTDLGWVAVKSGNSYCIDEVEVPSCLCETPNPTTDPTRNPTPSPTPFCEPVVEISVNQGCTADNLEALDTNVVYTALHRYSSLSEFGATSLTDTPQDLLSSLVLGHSCDTDDVAAAKPVQVNEQPYHDEPISNNQPPNTPEPGFGGLPYSAHTLGLFGYCVVVSAAAFGLRCKLQGMEQVRKGFAHQKHVYDS